MKNFFLVIPTRDRLSYLSNLLIDLNAFEEHISQVVIVDQSQQDIEADINKLSLSYKFTFVKNERENSVNHSRNQALKFYQNEEWLFFLDDDLRIPNVAFEKIIEVLKPNIIDVLIPGIQFEGMETTEFKYHTILDTISKPSNFSKPRFRLQVCSGLNITRRETFKEAGFLFDENFTIWGDDWDYGMRLLQAGANIYFQPKILVEHLWVSVGGQRDKWKTTNMELEKLRLYFYFLNKHFSNTVVKQQFYIKFFLAIKLLFMQGKLSDIRILIKAYRMALKMPIL
ncbi:glycosyltransferase family 2 protein [Flavobacterium tistrianum]|uniref:glycosyltransferase family 2 protein n=1 Tax=Flavobacterium tistrianum TaxID=1685414 RepID=UPI000DADE86E|nr:glycosyltransferase [Flavobacterium tistrianum]KAF2342020.1 glycosyltransferase family 2 protein [Flavobacterium tistrianum]